MAVRAVTPAMCRQVVGLASRSPFHLHPGGSHLALTTASTTLRPVQGAERGFTDSGLPIEAVGSSVVVVDTGSGRRTRPFAEATSWAPRWSPDGRTLAAYIQRGDSLPRLAFWSLATGAVRIVTDAAVRPFFNFEVPQWTADGSSVVVKLWPADAEMPGPAARPIRGSVRVFATEKDEGAGDLPGFASRGRADLAVVDRDTAAVRRPARDWVFTGWRTAPHDSQVAVLKAVPGERDGQHNSFDLVVLPVEGGSVRILAESIPGDYGICFGWSPDGSRIAYYARETGGSLCAFVVAVDGSERPREITDERTRVRTPATDAHCYSGPRWISDEELIVPHPEGFARLAVGGGGHIVPSGRATWLQRPLAPGVDVSRSQATVRRDLDTMDHVAAMLDPATGRTTDLHRWQAQVAGPAFASELGADGSVYLAIEAAHHPVEVWRYDRDFGNGRRLLDLNPDLDRRNLGGARLVRWRAHSTEVRRGALKLPPPGVASPPYPLVVNVYGGLPLSDRLHGFDVDDVVHGHLLTSRGYAVLLPDMPMTDDPPMAQFAGSVLPGIAALIEDGLVDPARMGVMGNSFGSYTVLSLLTQARVFAAAVVTAPMVDPISSYLAMNDAGDDLQRYWEVGQGRLGASLWERREVFVENAPVLHLDRVTTPLLIGTGTRGVPGETQQGIEAFSGLRRLGRTAELRIYEGEDHWPGWWTGASYEDFAARALAWFGRFLHPTGGSA